MKEVVKRENVTIYRKFLVLGCQVVKTPMYRAFATFLEGDKGDKRVTRKKFTEITLQVFAAILHVIAAILHVIAAILHVIAATHAVTAETMHLAGITQRVTPEFSREFERKVPLYWNNMAHYGDNPAGYCDKLAYYGDKLAGYDANPAGFDANPAGFDANPAGYANEWQQPQQNRTGSGCLSSFAFLFN